MQMTDLGPNTRDKLSRTPDGSDSPDQISEGALNMKLDKLILV